MSSEENLPCPRSLFLSNMSKYPLMIIIRKVCVLSLFNISLRRGGFVISTEALVIFILTIFSCMEVIPIRDCISYRLKLIILLDMLEAWEATSWSGKLRTVMNPPVASVRLLSQPYACQLRRIGTLTAGALIT